MVIRLLAMVLAWCYGATWPDDVVTRGVAEQRTPGYAKQEALIRAKDEGWHQCDLRQQDYVYDTTTSEECVQLRSGQHECTVSTCGHCVGRQQQ